MNNEKGNGTAIRILSMDITNFKRVRKAHYDFKGKNVEISGDNRAGKSTIFDAFLWLLFGKDSRNQDQTSFEIWPIDPKTQEPIHHLECSVSADLMVNGTKRMIKRVWREVWKKPSDGLEQVFCGNEGAFFVDDVPCTTKSQYDAIVSGWISENVFRTITNPLYFIDDSYTHWKTRRKMLVELAGNIDESGIRKEFADVVSKAEGRSLSDYKDMVKAKISETRKELARFEPKLEGMQGLKPERVDESKVEEDIASLEDKLYSELFADRKELADIELRLDDIAKSDESHRKQKSLMSERMGELDLKMYEIMASSVKEFKKERDSLTEELGDFESEMGKLLREKDRKESELEEIEKESKSITSKIESLDSNIASLREKYESQKSEVLNYVPDDMCPVCGQRFPDSMIYDTENKARESFDREKRNRMAKTIEDAKVLAQSRKDNVTKLMKLETSEKTILDAVGELEVKMASLNMEIETRRKAIAKMKSEDEAREEVAKGVDYSELEKAKKEITEMMEGIQVSDTKQLCARRDELKASISEKEKETRERTDAIRLTLQNNAEIERIEGEIEKEKAKARAMTAEMSSLEHELSRADSFGSEQMSLIEKSIDSHFSFVKWKMFDYTVSGQQVECCIALNADGVPFSSMNTGDRILSGMDVIRALGSYFGVDAPIFVDNAESVTSDLSKGCEAQMVRLIVVKGSPLSIRVEE